MSTKLVYVRASSFVVVFLFCSTSCSCPFSWFLPLLLFARSSFRAARALASANQRPSFPAEPISASSGRAVARPVMIINIVGLIVDLTSPVHRRWSIVQESGRRRPGVGSLSGASVSIPIGYSNPIGLSSARSRPSSRQVAVRSLR